MESNLVYLFAALALTWIVIVGYLLVLGGRLAGLQREIESLKRQHDWSDDEPNLEPDRPTADPDDLPDVPLEPFAGVISPATSRRAKRDRRRKHHA